MKIKFTLPYPSLADKENHLIFKQVPQISIAEVLQFVQKNCNFMCAFTHIKPYDAKDRLDPVAMMACIIANTTVLNALLEKLHKEKNEKLIEQLKYISPVAWIHINLYGYYSFEEPQKNQIDLMRLAESINMMKTL